MGQVETEQGMLTSSPRIPGSLRHEGPMDTLLVFPAPPLTPGPHLPWSHRLSDERMTRSQVELASFPTDFISEFTLCTTQGWLIALNTSAQLLRHST